MRKLMELVALLLCAIYTHTVTAQSSETQAGDLASTVESFYENPSKFQHAKFANKYYVWLHFNRKHSSDLQEMLQREGIQLLAVHSQERVLAAIPATISKTSLEKLAVDEIALPFTNGKTI